MSKGQTKKTREAAGNRRKLTRAEKKQIAAVIRQAKGDGKAHTAQQTIPYLYGGYREYGAGTGKDLSVSF